MMVNPLEYPSALPCRRRIRFPTEWNVPPHSPLASTGSRFATRSSICAGGFVREGEQQNISRIDPVLEQVGHAIGERARLARARAGDDKERARRSGHGRELLLVQLRGVIDVDRCGSGARCSVYWRDMCVSWRFGSGLQTQRTAATRRSQITFWRCRIAAQTRRVPLAIGIKIELAATVLGRHQSQRSDRRDYHVEQEFGTAMKRRSQITLAGMLRLLRECC